MTRLRRPCLQPGCPAVVSGRDGRCPEHAVPSRYRDPAQYQYYRSRAWRELSERVRREQPTCACGAPATQVHHRDGDWRDAERANLEAVCAPCHRSQSGRDHAAKRGQQPTPTPTPWGFA
jgi:hypothetical protein